MKISKSAKVAAPSEAVVRLYVADDFRPEHGGKVTAVGLFASHVVVVGMRDEDPGPSEQTPVGLEQGVALLIAISGLQGSHRVSASIRDASGGPSVEVFSERTIDFPSPDLTATLVVRLRPLVITSFGTKTVDVQIAGKPHQFAIEFRRGSSALIEEFPGGAQGRTSLPAKKAPRRRAE